jgi:hypothetical protein
VIRGISERHQVRSLNHGIGFDTAAIERGWVKTVNYHAAHRCSI